MSSEEQKEVRQLKLDNPVVVRQVPMTSRGCDLLRAIRDDYVREYVEKRGVNIEIPFPTAIHIMMEDFAKLKGIEIEEKK